MWLKLSPREPLVIGDVRGDSQFLASKQYIPGRAVRGAWALDLARRGHDGSAIADTVARLRIGNFFPAPDGPLDYALPVPMSALTCKRGKGFRSTNGDQEVGHGALDEFLPHLAYVLLRRAGAVFAVPFALLCSQCGDRMERLGGFYAVCPGDRGPRYRHFRPRFHAQTKVALSRASNAAAEGMLYTVSALRPNTYDGQGDGLAFVGRVAGNDEAVVDLMDALARTPVGALGSRGYGSVAPAGAEVRLPSLGQRVTAFNETLARMWDDLARLASWPEAPRALPEGVYFTVDLLAPGVFHGDGVPSLVATIRVGGRLLQPIYWMTRPDMASGWSTAWGLPKPTALAARMGSVYAFRWEGTVDELLPELERIEQEGVGERRDEGFGECLVCHPFHLEVEER